MEGGCYCGAVRYRLTGAPIYVNACHCRDCQKLTGSAFAVNAMVERDRIEIVSGRGAATDPDGNGWCFECHTDLWGTVPRMFGKNIIFLRAGTLDESETIVPDGHFFVRSKHPWVKIPDGVAAFETLPGEDERLFTPGQQARMTAAMAATRG